MKFWTDLTERAFFTYVEAFLGLLLAGAFDFTDISALQAAGLAALPAGLAVIKAGIATRVGDSQSAGFAD